ncbi:CoA transferase [Kitasatospora sp. MMS16-BH015]|uniref:CoA transferase n=1 Tax=Kitasatospora sp. MMS16-BH015 TaxID=2018025 RepID=UPI0020C47710|nr:CoA transferase [Kitasatospora sp. MMS16-BH015]
MSAVRQDMVAEAWGLLGGAAQALDGVRWSGPDGVLGSRLAVRTLAEASVAVAGLAAAELAAVRGGGTAPRDGAAPGVLVDSGAVAAAYASDRVMRLDGVELTSWAALSRFWRCSDGWVRTHANYDHHRRRLLEGLGLDPESADTPETTAAVERAVGTRTADRVAAEVTARGGLAVAVRSPGAWAAHEQGAAVAGLPLLSLERVGAAPAVPLAPCPDGPLRPAAGLRVLDLTRVIAGPVATRTLALLGADVLRIDSPRLPEIHAQHLDLDTGKRSCLLDLDRPADRAAFERLLSTADVVVTGYRPGALDRFGLDSAALLARRPSLVTASLCAWGRTGPWQHRRAFDSVVQAAVGIAEIESGPDGTPGAMPVQALDHSTGYLMAAAVLRAVTRRTTEGGGWRAELALAQTAAWLLRQPIAAEQPPKEPAASDWTAAQETAERETAFGRLRYALSPVRIEGGPADWARSVGPMGADAPEWL